VALTLENTYPQPRRQRSTVLLLLLLLLFLLLFSLVVWIDFPASGKMAFKIKKGIIKILRVIFNNE
jgi:hypothetical protein